MTIGQAIGLCGSLAVFEPDPIYYDDQFARLLMALSNISRGSGRIGKAVRCSRAADRRDRSRERGVGAQRRSGRAEDIHSQRATVRGAKPPPRAYGLGLREIRCMGSGE
jgi:hypothetical protein